MAQLHLDDILITGKGEKKKKKKLVKGKKKNKINTERIPAAYTQPADLSATFGESPLTLG